MGPLLTFLNDGLPGVYLANVFGDTY
jgi:hypothetical protein